MARGDFSVDIHGPFFTLGIKPVLEALRKTVEEVTEQGERKVEAQLTKGHGVATGAYKSTVHSQISASMHGGVGAGDAIKGAWLEGASSRNRSTRFKGYRLWRKSKQTMNRLKKTILENFVAHAVEELS